MFVKTSKIRARLKAWRENGSVPLGGRHITLSEALSAVNEGVMVGGAVSAAASLPMRSQEILFSSVVTTLVATTIYAYPIFKAMASDIKSGASLRRK